MRKPYLNYAISVLILIISGCATEKVQYRYVQIFQTNLTFEQAQAQCEYDTHLQNLADARANPNESILSAAIRANLNQTQVVCMKRYGWGLQRIQ